MTKESEHGRHGWFFWIGGACFLAGSLVAGSFGLASASSGPTVGGTVTANQGTAGSSSWPVSASQSGTWQQELTDGTNVLGTSSHPVRTDPTGTSTQPVSGSVGLSAGSNDIGNVGISGSLPTGSNDIGTVNVAAPTRLIGDVSCTVADGQTQCNSSDAGLSSGTVLTTLSVRCHVVSGQHVIATYLTGGGSFGLEVPLSFQITSGFFDYYTGTLTNVDVPIQSGGDFIALTEDYPASLGNGASCELTYTGTTS